MEKTYAIAWSPGSERDMNCLDCHQPHFDERALPRLKAGIFRRVELLGQFPEFGRELPRYGKQWRQLLYHPYRIIYFVEPSLQTVFISRIWHSSRAEPTEEDLTPLR